uniref:Uncharacterized protein n=1 Tax=Anguilla anguilla TaxID=7936 RepID=A0A0E9QEP0_ANGAN
MTYFGEFTGDICSLCHMSIFHSLVSMVFIERSAFTQCELV